MTNSYLKGCKSAFKEWHWRIMTLAAIALFAFLPNHVSAQYTAVYSQNAGYPAGTANPETGVVTTAGWTQLIPASIAVNQWSPALAIPFAFDFYGSPVTHLKMSGNGLVTFDTTATGVPPNNNEALPSASLPDNTVAAFWDEFTGSPPTGSNDRAYYQVFGTAPNRELWVKWYSYEWGPTGNFFYGAVVLEESTNIIHVIDQYGSTGLSGDFTTVGLQQNATTATFVGDNIATSGNGSGIADADFYTFYPPGFCIAPSNTSTVNITANGATGVWSTNNAGSNFQLELGPAGFTQGTGALASATDTFYNVTGLTQLTSYDWYVREICAVGDTSPWSGVNSFSTPATCPAPGSFGVDSATSTSLSLSWTAGGSETSWIIEYGTPGFSLGTGTPISTGSNPYTLSGLSPLSSYDFYIRAFCGAGDSSLWVGPLNAKTLPNGAQGVSCTSGNPSIIFTENFEDNSQGWTGNVGTGNGNWEIGIGGAGSPGTGPNTAFNGGSGSYMNYEASSTSAVDSGSVISPVIDLTAGTSSAELSFWLYAYGADMGTLEIGVGNSPTGPFANVFTFVGNFQQSGSEPWINVGVDLTAYVGQTIYLKFKQIDNGGTFTGDMSIDGLTVETCVSCAVPSNLAVSNLGATSVDLSWIQAGSAASWDVEYGSVGFTPGSGTIVNSTSNPYSLTGLTQATSYDFWVRAICGAGDTSAWVGPVSFATTCPISAVTLPFIEGFENMGSGTIFGGGSVECGTTNSWSFSSQAVEGRVRYGTDAEPGSAGSGAVTLDRDPSGGVVANVLSLTLDMTTYVSNTDLELIFDYTHHGEESHAGDRVWVRGSDTSAWVEIYDIYANRPAANTYVTVGPLDIDSALSSAGQTITSTFQIGFGQEDNFPVPSDGFSFDEIVVRTTPTCPQPTAVSVGSITETTASISWIEAGSATTWQLQYDVAGFTPGSGNFITTTNNPEQLTGLMANTVYDVYVRAICGAGDTSLWSSAAFQTACGSFAAPFAEDFETSSPSLSCWANEVVLGTDVWSIGAGSSGGAISTAQSGSLNARFTSTSGGPFVTKLVSPVIDMTSASAPELTFWYGQEVWFGDQNTLGVYYRISPTDPWVLIWSDSTDRAAWTDTTITLPNLSPTYQVAFEGTNNWGRANVVDNVTIGGTPVLAQIDVPVTFEDPNVNYTLTDFGGNASQVVVDPTDPTNTVAQSDKTVSAQVWAGTTMGDVAVNNAGLASALPFSAGNTVMTVRVWSPDAGTPVLLKVEDAADPTKSVETLASTTAAATWETLTFDFSNEAPGTAPINFATTYDKASIFFNFGTDGATAGAKTYYWDDVVFGAPSTSNDVCANALPITTNGLYACDSVNTGGTANHANATNARWFYFDAPSAGTISVDACGTLVDTRLWIMTGTCGATVDEAGDDDGCGPNFESVILGFPVNSGTRYYIQWDDRWSSDPFDFLFTFNACAAPTAVNVTNVTGTSADINFTSTATTELEWGVAGFTQGTGTLISPATSPESLSGLTNATTYGFYLRQICAPGDTSLWDGPFSFTTDLAPCAITAAPSASDVDVCIGSTATLTATLNDPNNSAAWYTSVGGPIVSISNPFTTPAITANATYYVAEANGTGGVQTHVGPAAPTGALTFPGGNFSNGIWFTVDAPLTLDSMTLVVNGALDGSINISSDNPGAGGVLLQSFNYSLPAAGTFQIPVGVTLNTGNYYMNLGAFTGTGVLFRSTSGANYPAYNLPNVVSIDSTNFGGGAAGTRFYYFWDWVVNSGCTGPVDSVSVTAIPTPDADFTFSLNGLTADFTSVVNSPDSVTWDFGDGNTGAGLTTTNIYAAAGTYNVSMTAHLGDCDSTITKAVSPTVGLNKAFNNSVSLYPNPSNGTFIVDAQGLSFDRIEVRDMLGKVVFQSANTFTNRSEITISNIATGNYIVTLINDEGMAIKQLTIK